MLRQLRQRPIALDGGKRHLRLESRAVVPAGSSVHGLSCSRQSSPLSGRNSTYRPVQICGAGSVRHLLRERIEFGQRSIVSIHCKSNTLRVSFAEAIREHLYSQLRLNHRSRTAGATVQTIVGCGSKSCGPMRKRLPIAAFIAQIETDYFKNRPTCANSLVCRWNKFHTTLALNGGFFNCLHLPP